MILEPHHTEGELPDERVRVDVVSGVVDCYLCGKPAEMLSESTLGIEPVAGIGHYQMPTGPKMYAHGSCAKGFSWLQMFNLYRQALRGAVINLHPRDEIAPLPPPA